MKPTRTWVLIADGARARILENDGPGRGLKEVPGAAFSAEHAATHDIVRDRSGRTHESVGPGRSAIEAHSDPHRELKRKFADLLAGELASALGRYDRLVLVAAPVTLGDLRAALTDQVRAKITGELASDLTKTPDHEVAAHLKDLVL